MSTAEQAEVLHAMGLAPDALEVNKHLLDDEFVRHPNNVATAAASVAAARRLRDELKLDLARTVSRVRREIQGNTKGTKVLVKDLELSVDSDPEVRKAERLVIAADYGIASRDAVLQGLQAKTSALKHLSELYQASYFVASSSPDARDGRRGRRE
jgi:hypothetical protein